MGDPEEAMEAPQKTFTVFRFLRTVFGNMVAAD
jgi:hypothetical protein